MPAGQATWPVLASAGASAALAVFKFVAGSIGGSAAVLAAGVHSAVDAGNSLLLHVGQRRSARPADDQHQLGHGMELYFWTLVVAVIMFAVSGCAVVAEGVARVLRPEPLTSTGWGYAALGASALFNGYTWVVALRAFRAGQGGKGFWKALERSKDPTLLTVLFEDTASLLGVAVAFLGLLLAERLDAPVLDGIASVLVGLLLAAVGLGLIVQCKTLLLGESAADEVTDAVRSLVAGDAAVGRVVDLRTMHFGPDDVLLHLRVEFRDDPAGRAAGEVVGRLERAIRAKHPEFREIWIAPAAPGPAARPA